MVPPGASERVVVTVVATLALSESEFDATAQDAYKASLAATAGGGVTANDVTLTIAPASIVVTAHIAVAAGRAAATVAVDAISAEVATAASSGTFMGVAVAETPAQPTTSVTVVPAPTAPPASAPPASPAGPPPSAPFIGGGGGGDDSDSTGLIIGVLCAGLGGLVVVAWLIWAKKRRAARESTKDTVSAIPYSHNAPPTTHTDFGSGSGAGATATKRDAELRPASPVPSASQLPSTSHLDEVSFSTTQESNII